MNTQVAIVGGGPVGLVLALFLDHYGVQSLVVESAPTTRWVPKGSTHNARTMEHYRRLGIASAMRNRGLPAEHATDLAYFNRYSGWELARRPQPSEADRLRMRTASVRTDQFVEPLFRCNQMYVERYLLEQAKTRPNITLRYGCEADSFHADDAGTALTVNPAEDKPERWAAQYLVGCDGSQSELRRWLGIRYDGADTLDHERAFYAGQMFATYLRAPTLYRDYFGKKPAWLYWSVNPEFQTALVAVNGVDEFLMFLKTPVRGGPPDNSTIGRSMGRDDIPFEILSQSPWTAGVALVAQSFGRGRVHLAGDSVHLFTPTGGFGMNTGIDDTANLSWKLAAAVHGWAGDGLLSTYEAERRPIAQRNTGAARQLAKVVTAVPVPPELEQLNGAGEAARRVLGAALAEHRDEVTSWGVQLGARYDQSQLTVSDTAPPADVHADYVPSAIPGGRAPHVWMNEHRGNGDSLFDQFGRGFTLLELGRNPSSSAGLQAAAAACGMPLKTLRIDDPLIREVYERDLVMVRPDQHIAWRGNRLPDDPARLIAQMIGAA